MTYMQQDCGILVRMLNNKDIESLHDDGFEGSIDEHLIFAEVFLKNDGGETSKRFLVTGVINFDCDCGTHTDLHPCSNCQNSSITAGRVDFCNMKENSRENSLPVLSSEGLVLWDHDGCAKQTKLSVDALSDVQPSLDKVSNSKIVTHRLVESSTQGVTSSCYLLKQQVEAEKNKGYVDAYKCKLSGLNGNEKKEAFDLDGNDLKEVVASKAIASPVSQESSATKVLILNPSQKIRYKNMPLQHSKRWKESSFLKIGIDELPSAKNVLKDPCSFVRYHVNRFLIAAGWDIGRRKRSKNFKGVGELVFRSPFGRPIREFYRAWDLCGLCLCDDANYVVQEVDGKQWTDSTQFLSDLSNVVVEIRKLFDSPQTTAVLAHGWCLLDPFATALLVDKLVSQLRAGKGVKASRGFVIDPCAKLAERHTTDALGGTSKISDAALTFHEDEYLLDEPSGDGGDGLGISVWAQGKQSSCPSEGTYIPSVDIVGGLSARYKRISGKKRRSSDLMCLPPCGSNNAYDQSASCLLEVPFICKNANITSGGPQPLSPHKGSNTCTSRYDKDRTVSNREMLLEVVNGVSIGCSVEQGKCLDKWKALKKSKKISEIKLTKLYHNHGVLPGSCKHELNYEPAKSQTCRHDIVSAKSKTLGENGQKGLVTCQLEDDDLLISAVFKNKSFRVNKKRSACKRNSSKSRYLRNRKAQKASCRLLPRNLSKGGKQFMEGKWFTFGSRTVLSWLIHLGVVFLNEVIQYRNSNDDTVVKDGLVTCDGILCRCCGEMLSFYVFKTHAGFSLNLPFLNLFMESGKSWTLCQLEAWSAEYKARRTATRTAQVGEVDNNDDSCGLCGDGGVLLCCENCPSTFHQACLYAQELPEGDWYCPNCTCQMCGVVADDKEGLGHLSAFKCSQCEHKYHEACLQEMDRNRVAASGARFCGESCEQIHAGLHSRIGVMNILSDGLSWTLLRCIYGDKKVHSAQKFVALKAECNSKLAVALTIMEECFLPMVDPRTGIDMIPHVVYNWGSQFPRLNYDGFYTMVLEKDDVVVSVASIRIHGVAVAEMPLIATCSKYRRQGMCRRLMNSIQEMLAYLKVKMLVICAIPDLVETWTIGFGFEPLEDHEKKSLSTTNLMVFPGTIWLKKRLRENLLAIQHFGVGAIDLVDTCHALPSEAVDSVESGSLPGRVPIVEPNQELNQTLFVREADREMGITHTDSRNLLVGKELVGHLHQRFSKLPGEGEASKLEVSQETSKLEGNRLKKISNVKSLKVCDNNIPCLTPP